MTNAEVVIEEPLPSWQDREPQGNGTSRGRKEIFPESRSVGRWTPIG